ncbi:MAG: M43 family zinc metalloprotease [Catalinimonas sp.]
MNKPLLLLLSTLLTSSIWAQSLPCGSTEVMSQLLAEHPELAEGIARNEAEWQAHQAAGFSQRTTDEEQDVKIIPIVFHVVHQFGPENVSMAQIEDAVRIINEDFRRLNSDTANYSATFGGLSTDGRMEFRLARIDPDGNCTDGVTRHVSTLTREGDNRLYDIINWDHGQYVNVYVVSNIASGAGAYAYRPNDGERFNHIVCQASQLGGIGASNGGNFSRRTLTHELGHYFNLPHTWGNSNTPGSQDNCGIDDGVDDTPTTVGVTGQNCNLSQVSCGSLDNVENYMDYSNCGRMFTIGQGERMQLAAQSVVGRRSSLWQPENLIATGIDDDYVPQVCAPVINDVRAGSGLICSGQEIEYEAGFYNVPDSLTQELTYQWSFPGATPSTSTLAEPTVSYETGGIYPAELVLGYTIDGQVLNDTFELETAVEVRNLEAVDVVPYTQDFESVQFPARPGDSAMNQWELGGNERRTWSRTEAAAFTGEASVWVNLRRTVTTDTLILQSSILQMPAEGPALRLYYRQAYRRFRGSSDIMRVRFSRDCGATWLTRQTLTGSRLATAEEPASGSDDTFVPTADEWKLHTVDIPDLFRGEPIMFRFELISDRGNAIYLDDIRLQADEPVSIEALEQAADLRVFPNPSAGAVRVAYHLSGPEVATLDVLDLLGRRVWQQTDRPKSVGPQEIEIKGLPRGVYMVRLTSPSGQWVRRLVRY